MDSNLLCDEVWLSSPTSHRIHSSPNYTTKEDYEIAFSIFLEKEDSYITNHGFSDYLRSHNNLIFSRFKAIQWLIKSCSRFNLSMTTLFNAANYLDRFVSMQHFQEWKNWMMELVAVACLSVASKFIETCPPSIYQIQTEGLNHTFRPMTIQQMELILLNTLEWRLSSTTAYSYVELLMSAKSDDFFKCSVQKELLVDRVTQLLLGSILEHKMVEYRPSITAISAIWCCVEEIIQLESSEYLTNITAFLNQNHKDEIEKCRKIIEAIKAEGADKCPSSPVTVLLDFDVYDGLVDLSIFNIQQPHSDSHRIQSNKKRRTDKTVFEMASAS